MSRSTVNLHLDALEAKGLIRREAEIDPTTKRHRPTRYFLAFEAVSENRTQEAGAVSDFEPKPCPKNEESRVRISDTNLVREPLREPVREESARDALAVVIGMEWATAFVAHRKALRAPMTPHAGKLMAKRLASMADPSAAVALAIERGWKGVFEESTVTPFPSKGPNRGERYAALSAELDARLAERPFD